MRFYIAAPWEQKSDMKRVRDILESHGQEVTATWMLAVDGPPIGGEPTTPDYVKRQYAQTDIQQIREADHLIIFKGQGMGRGGALFEMGWAYAQHMDIYIIGPRENVFDYLVNVHQYDSFDDFIAIEILDDDLTEND